MTELSLDFIALQAKRDFDLARLILHVVMDFSGRYGRGRVSSLLAGLRRPEILEAGLNRHLVLPHPNPLEGGPATLHMGLRNPQKV